MYVFLAALGFVIATAAAYKLGFIDGHASATRKRDARGRYVK